MDSVHTVLCVNSGSSSLKFALYGMGKGEDLLAAGACERVGLPSGRLWVHAGGAHIDTTGTAFPDHRTAVGAMFAALSEARLPQPQAVGHRLVSGGPRYLEHQPIDDGLLQDLPNYIRFAPLHLPAAIHAIEAVKSHYPALPQVACFDTAFHRAMPEIAARLPLPRNLWHEGVRKYGFHGLSYEYIVDSLGATAGGRLIVAHLGNGASMAAVRDGRPVDTTMGLTPTGGFMMGTRSGDLDPGVILYLLNEKGYDARQLERVLDHLSGLLGVSGISSDMQALLDKRASEPHAAQAIDMFCYQARKTIGALAAALGGLDTLVFTGGIGEHAAPVRQAICEGLEYLGVHIESAANDRDADTISASTGGVRVRVIPTSEDLVIARHTYRLLFDPGATP